MVFETVGDRKEIEAEPGFLHAIEPELVVPMVVYLASRNCELNHHSFSACAGRFARVFVGLGDGWVAEPGSHPTADDIAGQIDRVAAAEPYIIPTSIFDEVFRVCDQLGLALIDQLGGGPSSIGKLSRVRMPAVKPSSTPGGMA